MSEASRQALVRLRQVLLELHKLLLDHETLVYERTYGRVAKLELLQLALHHESFEWLRPVSRLIAEIDEALDCEEPRTDEEAKGLFVRTRRLVRPAESDPETPFGRKYFDVLQDDPDVILAHAGVARVLAAGL